MGTLPNTMAIITQIQTYLTGIGLYKSVVIGAQKDWTDACPIAEIMPIDDKSEHYASGGKIRDTQGFRVTSGVSFTQQTPLADITELCTLRDAVVPFFQQHALLGGMPGVQDSKVRPSPNRISFARINGDDYLIHELILEVRSVYNVPIGVNGL